MKSINCYQHVFYFLHWSQWQKKYSRMIYLSKSFELWFIILLVTSHSRMQGNLIVRFLKVSGKNTVLPCNCTDNRYYNEMNTTAGALRLPLISRWLTMNYEVTMKHFSWKPRLVNSLTDEKCLTFSSLVWRHPYLHGTDWKLGNLARHSWDTKLKTLGHSWGTVGAQLGLQVTRGTFQAQIKGKAFGAQLRHIWGTHFFWT